MQLASERVQRTGSGGVSQQQGGGFSEWIESLCQKSEAIEGSGARPRPVSIACRYVRTHAMCADKAVRAVQVGTVKRVWTLQETRRTSNPAKPRSSVTTTIQLYLRKLLRLNTTTKANSSSIKQHTILSLILIL